ncbi:unnamed protein product [Lupinus luteus]|uniref:Uncharacterized protein n=1 Tax=Lupinus luteus TaxID=3873 RepID=A0AAV1XR16_LUPLU
MAPMKFITMIILGCLVFSNCTESDIVKTCNGQETREACIKGCGQFCVFCRQAVGSCELNQQKSYSSCCTYEKKPPML